MWSERWRKILKDRATAEAERRREEWEKENEIAYSCRQCGKLLDDPLPRKLAYCPSCQDE